MNLLDINAGADGIVAELGDGQTVDLIRNVDDDLSGIIELLQLNVVTVIPVFPGVEFAFGIVLRRSRNGDSLTKQHSAGEKNAYESWFSHGYASFGDFGLHTV